MPRYFIHMAYDGTAYHGWQVQTKDRTIQQLVEHALSTLLKHEIAVCGAGRTDTGVHASFFIAHFDLPDPLELQPESLTFKLNRFLPPDIVVYRIKQVPDNLHARFSAVSRTYNYHITTIKPLFTREYAHHIHVQLDLVEIGKCCAIIKETSDFTSFSKLHTDVKTNNCMILNVEWKAVDQGYLFEIKADRFLRNMVRSIVGTLLDVGQGKYDHEHFRAIVKAKDRGKAGQSAPAKGLFLVDIAYETYS